MSYPTTEAPKLEIIFLLATLQAVATCLAAATMHLTKVILGRVFILVRSHRRCGEAWQWEAGAAGHIFTTERDQFWSFVCLLLELRE